MFLLAYKLLLDLVEPSSILIDTIIAGVVLLNTLPSRSLLIALHLAYLTTHALVLFLLCFFEFVLRFPLSIICALVLFLEIAFAFIKDNFGPQLSQTQHPSKATPGVNGHPNGKRSCSCPTSHSFKLILTVFHRVSARTGSWYRRSVANLE